MMKLFKNKLNIQKRAEQRELEKKSEAFDDSIDDFIKEEYENRNLFFDIIGFLCLLFAGILLLSYLSMNMEDLSSNKEIRNLLGIFGAYISSYSFLAFGFASYIIPAFFIYAGVNIILKNSADRILISAVSSSILMILFSILLNIFLGSLDFYNKGGILGKIIGGSLVSLFGKTGAVMIVLSSFLITAIIFAKVSIMDLVNYFKNIVKSVDLEKIKDIEQKVVNGIKDLEMKSEASLHTDNKEKVYTKDYMPLFYTKDVSELEFKNIKFIEKIENSNYDFDEKKYREKLLRRNDSVNNFFSKADINNKEADFLVNELRNTKFNGINVNTLEHSEEDLGLTLAEAVFGKDKANKSEADYRSSIEMQDDFYRNYYNDFINKKKNEEGREYLNDYFEKLDYNINYLKKSDFKRAAYDDSVNNYNKYNIEEQYIKANIKENYTENYYDEDFIYDYNNNDAYKYSEEEAEERETKEEDSFEKLQRLIEENKRNNVYQENDYDNISTMIETINKHNAENNNIENNKEEYILTSNNTNKNKKEAFEFAMGYASKRGYNRADHIPNYNNYTDSKIDEFDLDEEELFNANSNADSNIEDIRLKTRNIISSNDNKNNKINEYDNNSLEENNNSSKDNNKKNNNKLDNIIYEHISDKSNELENKKNETKSYTNFNTDNENINNAPYEESGFINIESQKTVDTLKPMKSIIGTKSIKNLDAERIQSNFDTKYVDKNYKYPPFDLLNRSIPINDGAMMESIKQTAMQLEHTLLDFNIEAKVTGVSRGPVITRYELEIASGIRVSKISNLTDNIALALASESVRIIAPIPGRSVIGIEIPNKVRSAVYLRDVLESTDFRQSKLDIPFVLGKGIYGNNVVSDMSEAPHLLVAGTTGSGKSVCLSTIILSLLYKFRPDELKFIFVDKKRVELSIYNGIPHLMSPVVSDEKKATIVLRYIVDIMEKRYERMERFFVRNVKTYNEKVRQLLKEGETEFNGEPLELFPYIVLVIDELHNLMVVASKEVEDLISRLAGMSRAVGIHLIIATQRPSADVVTGVIKANLPTRVAFQVPNKTNSRIIIDMSGAEQLLGKGDALFCASGSQMPDRVQGAFVSDNEVKKVVDYLSAQMPPMFDESLIAALEGSDADDKNTDEEDILDEELWEDAVQLVARTGKASASFLQRRLKIGYNRAARIVEIMERQGIVGPENGSKPREVLITLDE